MIAYFITERDVHAYVDNLLDARRRKAVENYLSRHAALAATVVAYRMQNATLAKLADMPTPMPAALGTLCAEFARRLGESPPQADNEPVSKRVATAAGRRNVAR